MKRILAMVVLICCFDITVIFGQNLHVQSFVKADRDLSARTNRMDDINGLGCALLKVRLAIDNAKFDGMIAHVDHKLSEYWVFLTPGAKKINITLNGFLPLEVVFENYNCPKLESLVTYILTIEAPVVDNSNKKTVENNLQSLLLKPNEVYVEGILQVGSYMFFGGAFGLYLSNVNIEASYLAGISESEEIFWNTSSTDRAQLPTSYTYKPSGFGGKVGYGIPFTNMIRFTPQVGFNVISLKGSMKNHRESTGIEKTYISTASVGAHLHIAIASNIGVSIAPEYSFGIAKGKAFDTMAEASSKIKNLDGGFNCRLGLNVFF